MNFYFKDPRLELNIFSRRLIRMAVWLIYIILIAAAFGFLFLTSGFDHLCWLGILLALFLIDRLFHFKQAKYHLSRIKKIHPSNKKINLADFLTSAAFNVIEEAQSQSILIKEDFEILLLKEILRRRDIQKTFQRLEISLPEFYKKLEEYLKNSVSQSPQIEKLVLAAYQEAAAAREDFIEPRNILVALATNGGSNIAKLFNLFSLTADDLRGALIFSRYRWLPATLGGFIRRPFNLRNRAVNRSWTSRPTPTLDKFSQDLTNLARAEEIGFLIGHEEEYQRLINILSRPTKPAVLLVGEPGIGKSTLINHLAYRIIKDRVPAALFDKRLISLELNSLVAQAKPEELSGRLKKIIEEIISAGNIVLYIPDIDNLVKTSGEFFLSAGDILLPAIKAGAFPVIGATYPREYRQLIEPQSDFSAAFEIIRIEEVSETDALKILIYESLLLEKQTRVKIKFGAIKQAVVLAHRYLRVKPLPASADEVLKEALTNVQNQRRKILEINDVVAIVESRTKIPVQTAGTQETEKLLNLEKLIHQRLINQEEAVKAVSQALREYRSGLARRGGPIATFLFIGPTGVGKTELSKILTQLQFGSSELMIRFDMSEYQDKQQSNKMLGTLTEAVSQKPYSLILLDEFEKSHPDILNLFLQVFDEGRLTDNLGRLVDFTNTIIIATSNAHSEFIKSEIEQGKTMETITDELKKKLTDYFKPELLNRFSKIIVFRSLKLEEIKAIAKLNLDELVKTLSETHSIELRFGEMVVQKVAELGFSPVFGARPLRQVIAENIRSVLAEKILRQEISRGDMVEIILENNEFRFKILR